MRKRTILLLLALMSALNCFASYVYDTVYVSTIRYNILSESDRTAAVTYPPYPVKINDTIHIFEYEGDIVIPSTVLIDGIEYRVTKISDDAFAGDNEMGCSKLTSITIPEGITYIGSHAFVGCSGLTSINIPASVTSIGDRAFAACNLDSITVALGNTVYDSRNDCNAIIETESNTLIQGCAKTVIPESVTAIGEYAFIVCDGLTSIVIPDKVRSIGDWAFCECKNLVSINIPESVDSIGWRILSYCPKLSSITVDINNPVFDSRENCNAIIETKSGELLAGCNNTVIPSGITSIGVSAFSGSEITWVVIPEGVINIENEAFQGCNHLSYVDLPYSLTTIGWYAFSGCDSLKSVVIPNNITDIGSGAFWNCRALTSVTILSNKYVTDANLYYPVKPFKGVILDSCALYVPDGCFFAYLKDPVFSGFYSNFDNVHILKDPDCTTINGINYCVVSTDEKTVRVVHGDYIGDVSIPSVVKIDGIDYSVVSISNEAFLNCNQLTSVVVNEGITSIGEFAFYRCESLKSANMPISVKEIGNRAFTDCQSLLSFNIPQGVKTIGAEMFEGCSALETVDIPSSIESIGSSAFFRCSSLKTIILPEGLKVINGSAFYNCSSLASISIPSSVNSIGSDAFYGCKSLESIIIPEGVNVIEWGTFSGCESLSYLSLPASVKTFGMHVFDDCYALKSAGPKGGGYNYEFSWTDTIPGSAFNGMKSLRSVYIPKSIKVINDQGLAYKEISINNCRGALLQLYKTSYFEGCDSLESLAMSFSDTKIIRKRGTNNQYKWECPADYYIYVGTPIHSITILDDTIKSLSTSEFGVIDSNIDEVVVSEYVKDIYPRALNQVYNIKNIVVEQGNSAYSSIDGVLYDHIGRELITYPSAREGSNCQIPEGVQRIADYAFNGAKKLQSVIIPQSVTYIGANSFEDCESLKSVTIKGSPQINYNAFKKCPNIEAVYSYSGLPKKMIVFDSPQAITLDGDDISNSDQNMCCALFVTETGERFFKVYKEGSRSWDCDFVTDKLPAGNYRLSIGILPNSTYELPNYIHPSVKGITDSTDVVLYNRVDTTVFNWKGEIFKIPEPQYITNDISGYDTILIVDTLTIPEGFDRIKITLTTDVEDNYGGLYAFQLWLERIFFEPLGDMPVEMYSGPFTNEVFNNATLYIPQIAVDAYRKVTGWKLFKNIAFDPDIESGLKHTAAKEKNDDVIYDLMGRRVVSKTLEQLEPGIYIINGSKHLVK